MKPTTVPLSTVEEEANMILLIFKGIAISHRVLKDPLRIISRMGSTLATLKKCLMVIQASKAFSFPVSSSHGFKKERTEPPLF
jgi:uncharacterized C2H2 Zn-finger protein